MDNNETARVITSYSRSDQVRTGTRTSRTNYHCGNPPQIPLTPPNSSQSPLLYDFQQATNIVRPAIRNITSRSVVNEDGSVATTTHVTSHSHLNSNYCGYTIDSIRNSIEQARRISQTAERFSTSSAVDGGIIRINSSRNGSSFISSEQPTAMIDEGSWSYNSNPLILIVTSTTVKKFKGETWLSTTPASKIYVNLNIPESLDFIERSQLSQPLEENMSTIQNTKPLEEKTIAEILAMRSDLDSEEIMVICRATITSIDKNKGWYYMSCKKCFRKLKKLETTLKCEKCNVDELFPKPRFE
ncbi:hypothetical protein LguiA_012686 [Lonicera macranthoides]